MSCIMVIFGTSLYHSGIKKGKHEGWELANTQYCYRGKDWALIGVKKPINIDTDNNLKINVKVSGTKKAIYIIDCGNDLSNWFWNNQPTRVEVPQ
jgi:hypothetical protein